MANLIDSRAVDRVHGGRHAWGEAEVRRDVVKGLLREHNLGAWREGAWQWVPGKIQPSRVHILPSSIPPAPVDGGKRAFHVKAPSAPARDPLTGEIIPEKATVRRLAVVSTHFQGEGVGVRPVVMFDLRDEAGTPPKQAHHPQTRDLDAASLATREPYLLSHLPLGRGCVPHCRQLPFPPQ